MRKESVQWGREQENDRCRETLKAEHGKRGSDRKSREVMAEA